MNGRCEGPLQTGWGVLPGPSPCSVAEVSAICGQPRDSKVAGRPCLRLLVVFAHTHILDSTLASMERTAIATMHSHVLASASVGLKWCLTTDRTPSLMQVNE